MKSLSLMVAFLSACFLGNTAQAKPLQSAPQRKISYSRSIPAFALSAMPKTGRSLFWGTTKPKSSQALLGFHLLALDASQLKRKDYGTSCRLALDIFTLTTKPQRLNRIPLHYRSSWPPQRFSLSLTWLDTKNKTTPLVVVKGFMNGIYGHLGREHLIAFPQGWTQVASTYTLKFGVWSGSDTSGQTNNYRIGQNGLTEIHVAVHPSTGELTREQEKRDYSFILRWNNKPERGFFPHAANEQVLKSYYYADQRVGEFIDT